jgi:phage terminase small subunit
LLDNSKIAARVRELQALHLKRHVVTVDRVLQEFARLAFLDIRKAFDADGNLKPIHEMDDDTAAAIAGLEVEVKRITGEADDDLEGQPHGGALKRQYGASARLHKIKLTDKKGALDSLARHLGMFVDKTEITGKDGGPVELTDAKAALLRGIIPNPSGK